jgi:hypothetical protein
MTRDGAQPRTSKAEEHLNLLRSLSIELERAIGAISSNNLPELEDSVSNQQYLSARLSQLASELSPPAAPSNALLTNPGGNPAAGDLLPEIRAAAAELDRLNLRYSFLLQFSSRSVALMTSLFNSFKGQLKEGSGDRSKLQTWSCRA